MLARLRLLPLPARVRTLAPVLTAVNAARRWRVDAHPQPARTFASSSRTRSAAAEVPKYTAADVSMDNYHSIADSTMDRLLEQLENVVDFHDNADYEVEYSSGVLTLKLGEHGTYVINKQPPNKQIWLSSPLSGPKRYDYDQQQNVWFYARDGQTLDALLYDELSKALDNDHIYIDSTPERE
ncbi:Frataxin [Exidia glandulosa HHB12029]|uniref:ferroxidase n=1 Tax=Exidia glandulosa HHB12029 TaxID=1314781 RepID=A0A165PBF7_EXIGL|nr:Frataxin [Exidia glandulosa HHB12029]